MLECSTGCTETVPKLTLLWRQTTMSTSTCAIWRISFNLTILPNKVYLVLLQAHLLLIEVLSYNANLRSTGNNIRKHIRIFFKFNLVGKWTISFEEWPWTNYPSYFFGPAIVLPQSTITPLFAASQTIPLMPIDDVYLTGICTEKAKIKLRFSSNSFTLVFLSLIFWRILGCWKGYRNNTVFYYQVLPIIFTDIFLFLKTSIFNFGLPDGCHLRRVLSWLTENLIDSHVAVENFYSNSTHNCIETYSNGTKVEVGHNVTAYFSFN